MKNILILLPELFSELCMYIYLEMKNCKGQGYAFVFHWKGNQSVSLMQDLQEFKGVNDLKII